MPHFWPKISSGFPSDWFQLEALGEPTTLLISRNLPHWDSICKKGLRQYLVGTCPAKKCDKLLVETDIFYHFRRIILCNAKRLHFHQKKQEHRGTVQKIFYSPILSPYKFDVVVDFVHVPQKYSSLQRLHCHFWWLLDKKSLLHKLDRVPRYSIWEKYGSPIFHN